MDQNYSRSPAPPQQRDPFTQYAQPTSQSQYEQSQHAAHQPQPQQGPALSVGAWIGISLASLGVVVAAILTITLVIVPAMRLLAAASPGAGTAPPVTQLPDGEGFEDLPGDSDGASDTVTLDDTADFLAGPFWGIPFQDGWEIDVFDVEGENRFSHPASGCALFSYQGFGPEDAFAATDREATELTVPTALQIGIPWDATADPNVSIDDSIELLANYSYPVEMMRLVADYPSPDGDRQRQMVMRTFMPNNAALYFEIDCPATSGAAEVAQQIIDELGITEF